MRTALDNADNDDLRRIADALERLADHFAPVARQVGVHTNVTIAGNYAGTKDELARAVRQQIEDAVKRGTIPPNWNAA